MNVCVAHLQMNACVAKNFGAWTEKVGHPWPNDIILYFVIFSVGFVYTQIFLRK